MGQVQTAEAQTISIGNFHIATAEVRSEEGKPFLFVAIDRTSKCAVAQLVEKANRKTAREFLDAHNFARRLTAHSGFAPSE